MESTAKRPPRWISGIEPAEDLLSASGTQILEIECRAQPQKLLELIRTYSADADIASQFRRLRESASQTGPVLLLGMGASLCSSISGSMFLQSRGRSSFSVDAGEWLHYGVSVWCDAALSILLTTSGESAELVELFRKSENNKLALVCNNPASTCWTLAGTRLPILAGPEYGNATKTYTNATVVSILAASEMLGIPWLEHAEETAQKFGDTLQRIFAIRSEIEQFCRGAVNIEIIGRGAAYGAAQMSALCIREMTGFRAAAHTGAGFRHGPNLDVDGTHLAIILAVGRVAELGVKLAQECNRRGGKVLLISEEDRQSTESLFPVRVEPVPDGWEGITSILPAQALTLAMTERIGCRLPPRFQYGAMEE